MGVNNPQEVIIMQKIFANRRQSCLKRHRLEGKLQTVEVDISKLDGCAGNVTHH